MGLELKLLPVEYDGGASGFSHSILTVQLGRQWDAALEGVHLTDPPDDFNTYVSREGGEPHYGLTTKTPYGDPLRCARVSDILTALDAFVDIEKIIGSRQNRAVLAYLRELDPKMKIALYWE